MIRFSLLHLSVCVVVTALNKPSKAKTVGETLMHDHEQKITKQATVRQLSLLSEGKEGIWERAHPLDCLGKIQLESFQNKNPQSDSIKRLLKNHPQALATKGDRGSTVFTS